MAKLSRKGALLFGGVLAVCAFAAPMASGASWSVVGTTHVLFSNNFSFTAGVPPISLGMSCQVAEFHADVTTAALATITGVTFGSCTGFGLAANCTVTASGTNFPWRATAVTTDNIQIHGVDIDLQVENHPGLGSCAAFPIPTQLTGTLTGGSWDPSATGANRRITFNHDDGLTMNSMSGVNRAFITGDIRDTTGTLNVLGDTASHHC